jgi:type II secretory pathway predicted ATPase ExeA
VKEYKEMAKVAILKRDEVVLKVEETEDLLHDTLEANTRAEERIKHWRGRWRTGRERLLTGSWMKLRRR